MNEYRVTIDSATEQYVYTVEADQEDWAYDEGLMLARQDGYTGTGMWVEVEEL